MWDKINRIGCNGWNVDYNVEDGARLNALQYGNYNLLTSEPAGSADSDKYGLYEMRPVYGYDDCFPTVDTSVYPGTEWMIPDHGELCWLKWICNSLPDGVVFEVRSKALPVYFRRRMIFLFNKIIWKFSLENQSNHTIYFQHVMHPLMKLNDIKDMEFPEFQGVFSETLNSELNLTGPKELAEYLCALPAGTANMLFVHKIKKGRMVWTYKNGLSIEAVFSEHLFPTIGVWWNNSGYPDEEGLRRNECAFEPTPGINSRLLDNYLNGTCLSLGPHEMRDWRVEWNVIKHGFKEPNLNDALNR